MANLERGFRRLTWVVSLFLAIPLAGLGVYGITQGDTAFAYSLTLLGIGAFVLSWAVFFILRWIAIGFRDGKRAHAESSDLPDDNDSDSDAEDAESWWRRLLRPFIRPFVFSYLGRPHCHYPWVRKDSWGVIHVLCGAPPTDTIDVKGLQAVMGRLKTGDETAAEILPGLLSATMDESGVVPVCDEHRDFLYGKVAQMFDGVSEQEQEAFREWLKTRKERSGDTVP
jgi:hypothetical protein